ncbi:MULTISPECIES: hypothetical protein [Serratia]|uniref:hypothetical protein n=1 Tax=Serratia TaxID=613 RepID=UPI0010201330|nr:MULTISPECIES: hypothetical protein [Serratia]TXE64945.1 hypothetical protein FOT59_25685 [Serratia nevei]
MDIENYCTLRLFFDLSTLAGRRLCRAALNSRSTVLLKRDYNQQVIMLNSVDVLRVGQKKEKYRGALIVEVSIKDLAPITAYHAYEVKIRTIMKDRG